MKILTHHNKAVRDVEWSQDGKTLLSCSYDRSAAVIDVEKGSITFSAFYTCLRGVGGGVGITTR